MSLVENLSDFSSLPSPLPPAPDGDLFTEQQLDTLFSILEVFVPSIPISATSKAGHPTELDEALAKLKPYQPEGASEDVARAYLREDAVSHPDFREAVVRKFKLTVPASDSQGLAFLLSLLNSSVGSYPLTGYTTPLHKQDLETRSRIICGWSRSRLPLLRGVYKSLSGLAKQVWVATSPGLYRFLDFPSVPKHIERNPSFDFKFYDFTPPSTSTTLSTDVVIVGSGCGAGVVASHLSRAGLKCLVLEKSYHFPSTHFPMSAANAGEHLMDNGGIYLSDDASIAILAGSTFGGGGTVNWSASLQPPRPVREDWAADNLPHFLGAEYQDCLDTVCERMGAARTTDPEALQKIEHNFANRTLLEGSRRLGIAVQIVPQNTASKRHFCGYCMYGCSSATKQGPANCWFPDAAAHGAEFIEGCWVEEVVFSGRDGIKTATGVKATWMSRDRKTSRQLTISARRVIVAAGTLQSPLVLLRSGLKNPHIGAHLHLHPTSTVWATWPQRTNPWEGAILTVAMTGLEDQDGKHHGPKVEVICSTPGFGLLTLPFRPKHALNAKPGESALSAAIEWRLSAAKHGFSTGFVCITRDADAGRVYPDPKDATRRRPRIAYTPSARDRRHLLAGIVGGMQAAFVMGALEIDSGHPSVDRWVRPSHAQSTSIPTTDDDEISFARFVDDVRCAWLADPGALAAGSAHQMGSCRMASSPKTGVVDSHGRVFGTEGLYVADASVFPSASGVNPMVSTMGVAEWIARGIVREVKGA
ncbi:hypothetical protein Z517_04490 [Fonsecaea pedrosoi CBS 271.37]|uniref:Uncharacterized protein n=1 Tax=Fonsecaea pedrosoi CBS 271.37 TaxID=1442368 RepID=A0A0D2GSG2_9EURO|nr:uncharacterized protein Z517_04490 [Fonsecaea pedrosoi CBS 271.37]KIW81465.1 hypothetical protein Z517_04490 [Fonsecaea pedrosoi CBS 271.37]